MTGAALAGRLATKTWRRVLVALTAVRRAQAATTTFATHTVFDHYCARIHTGLGLDTNLTAETKATGLVAPHGVDLSAVKLPIAWGDAGEDRTGTVSERAGEEMSRDVA